MDINLRRISTPITTGIVGTENTPIQVNENGESFAQVLQSQLESSGVSFSKHAVNRVIERSIDVSDEKLERLGRGMKIAEEKGLDDTLILIDQAAYIVNIRNNKVITTVGSDELVGNCFTNIDGTVII